MNGRERKERELAATCFWGQLISFPSLLLATATIHDTICYSFEKVITAQLWIDNGYTAQAPHPILRLSKAARRTTACSLSSSHQRLILNHSKASRAEKHGCPMFFQPCELPSCLQARDTPRQGTRMSSVVRMAYEMRWTTLHLVSCWDINHLRLYSCSAAVDCRLIH